MIRSVSDVASGNGSSVPRIVWKTPAVKQRFSLPEPIIRYIAMNPTSPEGYLKLISTCKHFFEVNPIFVVPEIVNAKEDDDEPWMNASHVKIWLTNRFKLFETPLGHPQYFSGDDVNSLLSKVSQRLFRCEANSFELNCNSNVDFEKIQLFTKMAKLVAIDAPIIRDDGRRVRLEEIFAIAPLVEEFGIDSKNTLIVDGNSFDNLSMLEHPVNLYMLCLWDIPQNVDLDKILNYLKKCRVGGVRNIVFFRGVNSEQFEEQLKMLRDEIGKVAGLKCRVFSPPEIA